MDNIGTHAGFHNRLLSSAGEEITAGSGGIGGIGRLYRAFMPVSFSNSALQHPLGIGLLCLCRHLQRDIGRAILEFDQFGKYRTARA